jgi:hypothetical protein
MRDGRLRHAELARGGAQTAVMGGGDERLQLLRFHWGNPVYKTC